MVVPSSGSSKSILEASSKVVDYPEVLLLREWKKCDELSCESLSQIQQSPFWATL